LIALIINVHWDVEIKKTFMCSKEANSE
jgi:hypothetical protein